MESESCRLVGMWLSSPVLLWLSQPRSRWMNEEQGIVLKHSWGLVRAPRLGRESVTPQAPKLAVKECSFIGNLQRAFIFPFCVN